MATRTTVTGTTTTSAVRLRAAKERDFAFLSSLHRQTLHDYVEQTWGWDEADQARRFRETFAPERSQIVVCDGEDAGVLEVVREGERIWIANIQIAPAWQRRGVGGRLIRGVLGEGKPVGLRVLKVNPARALYERLGFVVVEETETHWVMST